MIVGNKSDSPDRKVTYQEGLDFGKYDEISDFFPC